MKGITQRGTDRRCGVADRRMGQADNLNYVAKRTGPRERRTAQDPRVRVQWV